jgi:FkbM family methyltransferase
MASWRPPFYQTAIRNLPRKRVEVAEMLGRILGPRVGAVVNQAKVRLDLREGIQRAMFLGVYEPDQTEWFKQCLSPGDVVIDVGASFGYYTTLSSFLVGPTGKVFAFEPSPLPSRVIEEAIEESGIDNVLLTKAAVGSEAGSVSLFLPTTKYLHSPSILESDSGFIPIQVPIVALDFFEPLQGTSRVKLVKIDVEGYEPNVLEGMKTLIAGKRIENIICEFNSGWLRRNSTTPKQLLERFLDLGYNIRAQTKFQGNLIGHHGELFDLQDIWFSLSEA